MGRYETIVVILGYASILGILIYKYFGVSVSNLLEFKEEVGDGTNYNKNEDQDNIKANVLKDIFENGLHISLLETGKSNFAKLIAKKASRSTNVFYFLLFISSFLPFFFKGTLIIPTVVIPLLSTIVVLLIGFGLRSFAKYNIKDLDFKDCFFVEGRENITCWQKIFLRTMVLIPFSVRNIWWLILIIGILKLQFETLDKVNYSDGFNNALYIFSGADNILLNEYLFDFFQVFLISLVAYIATNIIRELTLLRERYVEGTEEAKRLNKLIEAINPKFDDIRQDLYNTTFGAAILSFSKKFEKYPIEVREVANRYIQSTTDLTRSMNNSILEKEYIYNKEYQYIQQGMLSARNTLIKNQESRIKAGHKGSILTTWNNLGSISEDLMKNIFALKKISKKTVEIYALQLKTPKRFIDKYINNTNDIGDEEAKIWRKFVNENISNAKNKKGNVIKRYFAKIDADFLPGPDRPDEYGELTDTELGLSDEYCLSKNIYSDIKKDIETQVIYSKNKTIDVCDNKTLKVILGEYIHKKDSCFIRTFTKDETDLLVEKVSKDNFKFIDYLAVYLRNDDDNDGEWLICVKSLYDKGFDTAKITLLQKDYKCSVWMDLDGKLSKIFFEPNKNKCINIVNY